MCKLNIASSSINRQILALKLSWVALFFNVSIDVKLRFRRYDGDQIVSAVTSGECDLSLSFLLPDNPNLTVIASIYCYVGAVVPSG